MFCLGCVVCLKLRLNGSASQRAALLHTGGRVREEDLSKRLDRLPSIYIPEQAENKASFVAQYDIDTEESGNGGTSKVVSY